MVAGAKRKDLTAAFQLAAEGHPLEHYKDILLKFQEEKQEQEAALAQTPAKKNKKAGASPAGDEDEDVEMPDADAEPAVKEKKPKKRKAEDNAEVNTSRWKLTVCLELTQTCQTPQRTDSVKKPKIKLNTSSTPKTANGVPTPKSAKEPSASKPAKPKTKKVPKDGEDKKAEKEIVAAKEPELSAEEKHVRKEVSSRNRSHS
jgi:hypothetical protein